MNVLVDLPQNDLDPNAWPLPLTYAYPCPDSRLNAANCKVFNMLFPAVGNLQSLGRLVIVVVLVSCLLLLAVGLRDRTARGGMVAISRG